MVPTASLFNQLLQHFPRTEFAALVKKHGAERAAKGFGCWTQFVAMLFCQLGRADSLREICNGLACCLGRLSLAYCASHPPGSTSRMWMRMSLASALTSSFDGVTTCSAFHSRLMCSRRARAASCCSWLPAVHS